MITDERLNTLERDADVGCGSHTLRELIAEIRRLRGMIHPVTAEQFKALNDALDAPPKDLPALRELLTGKIDPLSGTPDGIVS